MEQRSSPPRHPRSASFTSSTKPTPSSTPSSIKPTSRARAYRIPNISSDAAGGLVLGEGGLGDPSGGGQTQEFLWATREIAALDFLMNVPLCAEREIVRAGLSGERWHRHPHHHHHELSKDPETGITTIDETAEIHHSLPQHRWSNFTISRNPSIEDDSTVTLSTVHSVSEKGASLSIGHNHSVTSGGGGRWWDKLILKDKRFFSAANQQAERREMLEMEERDLEGPSDFNAVDNTTSSVVEQDAPKRVSLPATPTSMKVGAASAGVVGIPGRRLDGREAVSLAIPNEFRTRPLQIRTVARHAAVREWEMKVAWHGINVAQHPQYASLNTANNTSAEKKKALLDSRVFFSSKKSYPMAVFSCIKYEPQKEEAARRRKKLEELGGGGTQFVLPERDWRGISYRALLPQKTDKDEAFNRLKGSSPSAKKSKDKIQKSNSNSNGESSDESEEYDSTSVSSEESDDYVPGFLDDPAMKQGRHRNVMVGDKITGPIISSTIQFVKPSVLKSELNKQFRERFDQWEPPKSQRKYIGALVIDGVYTLIDPTEIVQEEGQEGERRPRSGSLGERETIRMPPSLTLSKIRSLKQQALVACVRSQIELSTTALACVYFERLCLDCRVDKSNRRLSFAACLFLAAKVNESNTMIAFDPAAETKSWVKPSKKSGKIFESLIVFFTHDWSISLKQLYAAEWIVFTALGFSLKSTPSQVAFHFKRLIKVLEWDARSYLGNEMYSQWQESLREESRRKERRKLRRELRVKTNERKLLKLQRKMHQQQQSEGLHRRASNASSECKRRHSISTLESTTTSGTPQLDKEKPTVSTKNQPAKVEGSPAAVRGILSRLSRPKMDSHGKDLDRLPKQDKKLSWAKHSYSSPNLTALGQPKSDHAVVEIGIEDKISKVEHSPHSKDDTDIYHNMV